jgi:hypothetical protein
MWSWPNLKYYPSICLERLTKTKHTSQDAYIRTQDLNMKQ